MLRSVIITEIEEIKSVYPGCYYDESEDAIYINENSEQMPIAENASQMIYEYFEGNTIETNEYDPADRSDVEVSGKDYVECNYLGLEHAFNSI